jgi:transcriptional antiterminator RfaH
VSELAEPSLTVREERARTRRWLVLYARGRFEKKVHARLEEAGITSFLPLRDELRQWTDRKKLVSVPLFSGYIFVRVNERERVKALESEGALKYVGFGGKLAVIPPHIIESLKIAVTRPREIRVEQTRLKLGQPVRVQHGPLAGMRGRLVEFRGNTRIAITIEAINQVVSVEVALADVAQE